MKNTFYEFQMENDCVINVTLNFYRLYQLQQKRPTDYRKFNEVDTKPKMTDALDPVRVIYTAYLCANLEESDLDYPTFESFLMDFPEDRNNMWRCYRNLMGLNKSTKKNTETHSEPQETQAE